ncbi:MAG: ACP S-malonyltransferase [Candidatus Caldatribacteriaceae bacterium]
MGWVFLFPGQGSQKVGMLEEWKRINSKEVESIFAQVNTICGVDLLRLVTEGPEEELSLTFNAQPAILAVSMLIFRFLEKKMGNLPIAACAGHSLGEYSALCAAQSLDFEEAIFLVRKRGEIMQKATPQGFGTMVAVMGLPLKEVEQLVLFFQQEGEKIEIANINSSEQVVLSLQKGMVERVMGRVIEMGGKRAIELKVSAPFHSSFMKGAAEEFAKFLDEVRLKKPRYPYVSNVTASYVEDPEKIKALLAQQMISPVQWRDIMALFYKHGERHVVEIGPGTVLSKLFEREYPEVRTFHTGSLKATQSFLREAVGSDDL